MSSPKESVVLAPLEDIDLSGSQRIRRWCAEVHRESKTYHGVHTPFKSIDDWVDYGAYPPQKAPLEYLPLRRSAKADILNSLEGPQSASDASGDRNTRHSPASKHVHKHKTNSRELSEGPPNKRRRLEPDVSPSLDDSLQNRTIRAKCRDDLSHSLKASTPRLLPTREGTNSRSVPVVAALGIVNEDSRRTPAKHHKSYERQPRRKTKEDKYEPKVKEKTSKFQVKEKKRAAAHAPTAVKSDFKAPSVLQNRLTVRETMSCRYQKPRPCTDAFSNSSNKANILGSFPKARHRLTFGAEDVSDHHAFSDLHADLWSFGGFPVPDLSFPEMNFLSGHKDRHVEPDSHAVIQQKNKNKPKQSDQYKISERFSRPLVNQDQEKFSRRLLYHNMGSTSTRSPVKSGHTLNKTGVAPQVLSQIASASSEKSGRSQGRDIPFALSRMVSASPKKRGISQNHGVPPILSHQENVPPHYAQLNIRDHENDEAGEDLMGRTAKHFPWSTSNFASQRTRRQPLADVSKEYLSLDDLHQLLQVRQKEDQEERLAPSSPIRRLNHGAQSTYDTPSLFRAIEVRPMRALDHQRGRQNVKQAPSARKPITTLRSVVSRTLPRMYARQILERGDVGTLEGTASEWSGCYPLFPGSLGQFEPEIKARGVFHATHTKYDSSSPLKVWTDPQAAPEDDEVGVWGFRSSKSRGRTRHGDSPQKATVLTQARRRESGMLCKGLLVDGSRHTLVGGVGDILKVREASQRDTPMDVGRSALAEAQQEVNAKLEAKGFWRRRVL